MPRMNSSGRRWRDRGQSRSAKHTAWRNSIRNKGHGFSRSFDLIPDHALPRSDGDKPVLIENRPHSDFYFPITGEEALARIELLPKADTEGITHVWLRRMGPKDSRPFASYCCGPDHAVIVLYPWPRSLCWWLGTGKPSSFWRWLVRNFDGELSCARGHWYAAFTRDGARRVFLDQFLLHEVGHHADWREFSDANDKQVEDFANQYAVTWARRLNRRAQIEGSGMTRANRRHLEATLASAFANWTARIEDDRHDGPTPGLTVSFRLFDRRGRARSNTVWIRPAAIPALTVAGARQRVERAGQR